MNRCFLSFLGLQSLLKSRFAGLLCCLFLGSFPSVIAKADERMLPSEIRDALRGPVDLILTNNVTHQGSIMGFDGEIITIMVRLPRGGEAELTFPTNQVARIVFPGSEHLFTLRDWMADADRAEDALLLFRAFYNQQAPYFSMLRPNELLLFVEYVRFALSQNQPLLAIAMAEAVTPFIADPRLLRSVEEDILLATLEAGLVDEAMAGASRWVRTADPGGISALGWRILAEVNFQRGDFESALWAALNPIAFSGFAPMSHLAECYAYAVLSAEKLRLRGESIRLHREMKARRLEWPPALGESEPVLPSIREVSSTSDDSSGAAADILAEEEAAEKTPSPIDPLESLPTRILF